MADVALAYPWEEEPLPRSPGAPSAPGTALTPSQPPVAPSRRSIIQLPYKWTPRPSQVPIWEYLHSGGRRACIIWHRREGKDEVSLHWTACAAHMRVGNYWHMLPEAAQARKALWNAVNPHTGVRRIDEVFPHELRSATRDQEMLIRFHNGSTWQVLGSDNFDSLIGSPPIGTVFSEWPIANPVAWARLRPILLENKGWALFNGTPRGRNHGYRTYQLAKKSERWFGQLLTVDDTGRFTQEELAMEKEELVADHGEDLGLAMFEQEYYCSFNAAIRGTFFSKEMRELKEKGRISNDVDHIPGLPVHTFWDIGVRDPTAIVFAQKDGIHWRIINYFHSTGAFLADYVQVLEDKRKEFGYTYGAHVGPHDLEKREWGAGLITDQASKLGLDFQISPRLSKVESIQHVRKMLPYCWFHEERCAPLVDALEQHRCAYNEEAQVESINPLHDWTSHPVDAFKYGAQAPSYFFSRTWEDEEDDWEPVPDKYLQELDRCAI